MFTDPCHLLPVVFLPFVPYICFTFMCCIVHNTLIKYQYIALQVYTFNETTYFNIFSTGAFTLWIILHRFLFSILLRCQWAWFTTLATFIFYTTYIILFVWAIQFSNFTQYFHYSCFYLVHYWFQSSLSISVWVFTLNLWLLFNWIIFLVLLFISLCDHCVTLPIFAFYFNCRCVNLYHNLS